MSDAGRSTPGVSTVTTSVSASGKGGGHFSRAAGQLSQRLAHSASAANARTAVRSNLAALGFQVLACQELPGHAHIDVIPGKRSVRRNIRVRIIAQLKPGSGKCFLPASIVKIVLLQLPAALPRLVDHTGQSPVAPSQSGLDPAASWDRAS